MIEYRPTPHVELYVQWNGTEEAKGIREQQKPAPPLNNRQGYDRPSRDIVIATMQKYPQRFWTIADLSKVSGISASVVSGVFRDLRELDAIEWSYSAAMSVNKRGRIVKFWLKDRHEW